MINNIELHIISLINVGFNKCVYIFSIHGHGNTVVVHTSPVVQPTANGTAVCMDSQYDTVKVILYQIHIMYILESLLTKFDGSNYNSVKMQT